MVDARLKKMLWSPNGEILAVAGAITTPEGRDVSVVQFYRNVGGLQTTLRVPGTGKRSNTCQECWYLIRAMNVEA